VVIGGLVQVELLVKMHVRQWLWTLAFILLSMINLKSCSQIRKNGRSEEDEH